MPETNPVREVLIEAEAGLDMDQALKRWRAYMRRGAKAAAAPALAQLTREPGPPIYPLRWQTERQRRAYFATDGFGKGIPYRRTGFLLAVWGFLFEATQTGGELALTNPSDIIQFVQGEHVQKFHLDTGWVQIADAGEAFFGPAEALMVDAWFAAVDPLEGG